MKSVNHKQLASHLWDRFLGASTGLSRRAFLFGCVEPDLNPFTYLKGSFRNRMLKGHNFGSADRCLARMADRLQREHRWNLLKYYQLGKLMHYLSDAFTAAHNEFFTGSIREHRCYEFRLNDVFPDYLIRETVPVPDPMPSVSRAIFRLHSSYCDEPRSVRTDARFILEATESAMRALLPLPAVQPA